ncbi:MAG: coproporphyrinogen III oxidase, partial [Acidocella sp.]|nr:coproporphyrinogen III oxidase [Acidocella sp.]
AAPTLLAVGASSIGSLPQGYVQNATSVPAYATAIMAGRFATVRGVALTAEDILRRIVIEKIMCDLHVDLAEVAQSMGADAVDLLAAADNLLPMCHDGLVTWDGLRLSVTERGRPFVRNVAAVFDAYLNTDDSAPKYARAV